MSDEQDVSDVPVVLGKETHEGRQRLKVNMVRGYVPPLDGTQDDFDRIDQATARYVAEILVKTYFGYPWHVTAETRQGVVMFRIPDLMGPTLQYVINLAKFSDLTRDLIIRCGGELLERMNLPRTQIDMALYVQARHNLHKFDFFDVKGSRRG